MKLILIALILFGCTSEEPDLYEKLHSSCNRLCKEVFHDTGTVSRVSNAGITCTCGVQ